MWGNVCLESDPDRWTDSKTASRDLDTDLKTDEWGLTEKWFQNQIEFHESKARFITPSAFLLSFYIRSCVSNFEGA